MKEYTNFEEYWTDINHSSNSETEEQYNQRLEEEHQLEIETQKHTTPSEWQQVLDGERSRDEYFQTTLRSLESFFEMFRYYIKSGEDSQEFMDKMTGHLYSILTRHHIITDDYISNRKSE